MPLSRSQYKAKIDRLLKKINTTTIDYRLSVSIIAVAKSTLEFFSPDTSPSSSTESTTTEIDPAEVKSHIKDLLPSPSQIFTDEFFTQPLFAFVILHEVATLFGCDEISNEYTHALELSQNEKNNKRFMLHVWLSYFLECNVETCKIILQRFMSTRGSANPLIGTGIPSGHMGIPSNPPSGDAPPIPRGQSQGPDPSVQDFRVRHNIVTNAPRNPEQPPLSGLGGSNPFTPSHIHNSPNIGNGNGSGSHHHRPEHFDDSKKANYVQQMFRDNKFNGDLSQDIMETMKLYGICSRQYHLTQPQKADFLVHVFEGAARKFFFENTSETMPYNEMVQVMLKEYVSDARQMQAKGTLETLRLRSFMQERDLEDVSDGLTKLVERINELSPQCPPDFRSDAHKIDYLRKSVTEFQDWSRIPIQNITSQGYTFNAFVTTLHESLQNLRQIRMLTGDPRPSFSGIVDQEVSTHMMQYGRNPRFSKYKKGNWKKGDKPKPRSSSSSFDEARRRNECHRCGASGWNPRHRCDKGSIAAHARNRLKNGESSVHIVADLVQQMEGDLSDSGEEEGNTGTMFGNAEADVAAFDSLVDDGEKHVSFATEPEQIGFVEPIEVADHDIYVSQLAAAMAENDRADKGFRPGDEDC